MHDNLKDAAIAAAMSDDELVAEFYDLGKRDKSIDLQQPIVDEMRLIHIPEAVSACWPVPAERGTKRER